MIRLRTDFNTATEDEATALAEGLFVALAAGEWIELFDADQNSLCGVVTAIAHGLIYVRPDWETWTEGPQVEFPNTDPKESLFVNTDRRLRELSDTVGITNDAPVGAGV